MSVDPLIAGAVAHVVAAHNSAPTDLPSAITQLVAKANQRTVVASLVAEAATAAVAMFHAQTAPNVVGGSDC